MFKWYEKFGDRDILSLTLDELREIVDEYELHFELEVDNSHTPDSEAVNFVMVLRRCIVVEEELEKLRSEFGIV